MISFIKANTELEVGMFTNSLLTYKRLDSLVDSGMDQYLTSVNSEEEQDKSKYGIRALSYLKKKGFTNLRANVIVGRNNIHDIPELVGYLSDNRVYVSLSPIHVGEEGFWQYRCPPNDLQLRQEDKPEVEKLAAKLLEMKKKGILIANSEQYITDWANFAIGTSWHCKIPPVLWIDSDGKMMCCNDIRGETSSISIFDLNEKYDKFLELIKKDAEKCPGCFYNCQYDGKILV